MFIISVSCIQQSFLCCFVANGEMMKVCYDLCLHCGACAGSCPVNAIYLNDYILEFSAECTNCRRCIKICPVGALSEASE